jgi:excisionase family DNA binding protein
MKDERLVLSMKEAARRLDISHTTLERLIQRGAIKSVKVSPRRRVIPVSELRRIVNSAS